MRILFFDTETNGLPYNRYLPPTHLKNWPHILQIAWQMWDIPCFASEAGNLNIAELNRVRSARDDGVLVTRTNILVRPAEDLVWSVEAAAVHGIRREDLDKWGRPIADVLRLFKTDVQSADLLVAHNLSFDKSVIWAAALRTGAVDLVPADWWPSSAEFCTMKAAVGICKIPSKHAAKNCTKNPKDPYKWPTLSEVWSWLWPGRLLPKDLHDAAADVGCLVACWRELERRNLLVLPAGVAEAAVERLMDRFTLFVDRALRLLGP